MGAQESMINQLQEELRGERGRLQESNKRLQASKQQAAELHEQLDQLGKQHRDTSKKVWRKFT